MTIIYVRVEPTQSGGYRLVLPPLEPNMDAIQDLYPEDRQEDSFNDDAFDSLL